MKLSKIFVLTMAIVLVLSISNTMAKREPEWFFPDLSVKGKVEIREYNPIREHFEIKAAGELDPQGNGIDPETEDILIGWGEIFEKREPCWFIVFIPKGCLSAHNNNNVYRISDPANPQGCRVEVYMEEGGQIVEYLTNTLKWLDVTVFAGRQQPGWKLKLECETENPAEMENPVYLPHIGGATNIAILIGDDGGTTLADKVKFSQIMDEATLLADNLENSSTDDETVVPAHCSMSGGGTIVSGESFAGTATVDLLGGATGTWNHWVPGDREDHTGRGCDHRRGGDDHPGRGHNNDDFESPGRGCDRHRGGDDHRGRSVEDGDHFHGVVTWGACRIDGVSRVTLYGTGTWNGVPGYTFEVAGEDRYGAGPDSYTIYITDPDGMTLTHYANGELTSGDLAVIEYSP